MKRFSLLIGALCACAALIAPELASAASIAPSTIVKNAQSYDGQSVTVTGTIQSYTTRDTRRGTIALFKICDTRCVNAIDPSGEAQTNGSQTTVTGTFHLSIAARKRTFSDVIVIGR